MRLYSQNLPKIGRIILAGDHTAWSRPDAPTLKERTYEHYTQGGRGGRPITPGYGYSTIAWIPETQGSWALPLRHERITSWDVAIVEIGTGNAGAAMEAERAINHFQPNVILFIGVASGIKDVSLGDVVAATKVYGYESGQAKIGFEPRPDVGLSTYKLIQRARAEAKKEGWLLRLKPNILSPTPNVLVAPIAAGEKVVTSKRSSLLRFLQTNYGDAIAVEMEGRGLLQASHANQQVSALIVRGISDLINSNSKTDKTDWQEIAARHASAFAFEILAKL